MTMLCQIKNNNLGVWASGILVFPPDSIFVQPFEAYCIITGKITSAHFY